MQAEDLTAWLNSILVDTGIDAAVSGERIAESALFRNQVQAICDLYKEAEVNDVLGKVDAEVSSGRFFVSRKISLATHFNSREQLIELLLLNYHPMWLLLALCAILSCNFGIELDRSFDHLDEGASNVDKDRVFMAVLESIMQSKLLSDDVTQVDAPASGGKKNDAKSLERDRFNAVVLRRVLHLIFLLDRAKQSRTPVLSTDPPLFRIGSAISSSQEVIEQLGKDFLPDHGDVVRFLAYRGYWLTYVTPLFERDSLIVKNLRKDLCDGVRLCKLASMLVKDRGVLSKVRRVRNGMSRKDIFSSHLGNVSLALSKMEEYANSYLDHPFEWKGTQQDIVNGDIDKIIIVLWQVSSLWLQINILNKTALASELEIVQQEFREAKQQSRVSVWSPGGSATIPDLNHRVVSPSRLTVYENCETKCGLLLLKWCATVAGMYGIAVRDFTESFRDGAPLCVILHHYCPELVRAGEFTRVQQAELRSVNDSEAESEIVQKNFDLFTSRARLLGAIPHILIRAEAALAPPFTSGEKDASFGRVMELLSSYLFKRLTLEREGQTDEVREDSFALKKCLSQDQFQNVPESSPSSFHAKRTSSISANGPHHSTVVVEPTATDLNQPIRIEDGKREEGPSLLDSAELDVRETGKELHDEKQLVGGSENENENTSLLYLNDIDERKSDGELFTESSSSGVGDKAEAAKLILRYYRASRLRRSYKQYREAAVLVQTSFRGHNVRKKVDRLHEIKAVSEEQNRSDKCISDGLNLGYSMTESVPLLLSSDKDVSTESTCLAPIRTSREILDQTITLLPMLEAHMNRIQTFAARMISHERNQAALSIQRCYRARCAAASAVATTFERSGRDTSNNPWSRLKSGVFSTVRSISRQFFAEAEVQRKAAVTALTNALYRAEQAYQMEMRTSANQVKRMDEAAQHRRSERTRMGEMFFTEEKRNNETLKMELQSLNNQVMALEAQLLDREEKARAAESPVVLRLNPVALSTPPSKMPLEESTGSGRVSDLNDGDDLEVLDVVTLQNEIAELRQEEKPIIEEIEKAQSELTTILEAQGKELQIWRSLVLVAAHHVAEHAYVTCMEGLYEVNSRRALEKMELTSNLSLLDEEEKQMVSAKAAAFAQLDLNVIMVEKFCTQEEQWITDRTRYLSSKLSDACAVIETLYDIEEKGEAEDVWKVLDESFKAEVNSCARDQRNFENWRCAADLRDNALNDEIDCLEREEEQIAMVKRLHTALDLAEDRYLSAMQASNAAMRKDQVQRAKRLVELSSIADDEEILQRQFNENLISLNRALDGLDSIMEERGKYVQSLVTPTRNTVAYSPILKTLPLTAMKSSPSIETRPLQELSNDIVQALHFIDTQTCANSDMNENETSHERSSSLDGSSPERNLCCREHHRVVDDEQSSNSPQAQNTNELSSIVEGEEITSSTYISNENCHLTPLQEDSVRNGGNVTNEGRTQSTVTNFIGQVATLQEQHWARTTSSENVGDDKGFLTGSHSKCTESGAAVGMAEVENFCEKAAEVEVDETDNAQPLYDAQTETHQPSLRENGLFRSSSTKSSSVTSCGNVENLLDYDNDGQNRSVVATNSQTGSPWHNESCQSAGDDHRSCSVRSTPSSWTNETMQGSLLPLDDSPQWTGNIGSGLTSRRSSPRNGSSQIVLASLENRINHIPSREDVAVWKTPKTSDPKRATDCLSNRLRSLDSQQLSAMAKNTALESENTLLGSISEGPTNGSSNLGVLQREGYEPLKTPSTGSSYSGSFSALEMPSHMRSVPHTKLNFSSAAVVAAGTGSSLQATRDHGSCSSPLHVSTDFHSKESAFEASISFAPSHSGQGRWSATKSLQDKSPIIPAFSSTSAYISLEKPNHSCTESRCPELFDVITDEKEAGSRNTGNLSLRRLSRELSEVHVEISKNSGTENYSEVATEVKPLESILRRISVASSKTANARSSSSNIIDAEEEFSVLNVIRAICIIIRQCDRTEGRLELVKLGMSIIRDMCRDEKRVESVLLQEDCVEVIVTCVQFYRDNEEIITSAVQALLALSLHSYGEALLATHANFLGRLRGVQSILQLQNYREAICNDRLRRASVILRAVENRRQNQGGKDFSTELAEANSVITAPKLKVKHSAELLETLLKRFPTW